LTTGHLHAKLINECLISFFMVFQKDIKKYLSKNFLTFNKMIVKTIKVTDKGQISIPVDIRKLTGIKKGDNLLMIQDKDKILIEKQNLHLKDNFKDLIKHSEEVAKRTWNKKEDEVWDNV
jgi:AbrB family looped-hinge helix DNA binding protein